MTGETAPRATGAAPVALPTIARACAALGMQVFERGWLSSNNVLLRGGDGPSAVVDTGYGLHAGQTVALVERALDDAGLDAIVNTHLHSDHCGGNAALQRRWPAVTTLVPEACVDAARDWDEAALTFSATDQRCERFAVDQALRAGQVLQLGASQWEVHAAPGHDPTAVMLFQPQAGFLISADALWEQRLAIVFPELVGESGFADCLATLDAIERLNPAIVVPGHGRPFVDIATALDASRRRLDAFARNPAKHRQHAVRALVMFHMLEVRRVERDALADWLLRTPITGHAHAHAGVDDVGRTAWANGIVDSLIADRALREEACGVLVVAAG